MLVVNNAVAKNGEVRHEDAAVNLQPLGCGEFASNGCGDSKSPLFPNACVGNPAALGLCSKKSVSQ